VPDLERLRTESVRSARFALEPLRVDHAEEMVVVLGDARLYEFIGGSAPSLDELRARYARQVRGPGRADEVWLNWVIRDCADERAVGYVQATLTGQEADWTADLAWLVGSAHQGKGIATEAATGVASQLRECGITMLSAHIADSNAASIAVATRVGLGATDELDADGERIFRSGLAAT